MISALLAHAWGTAPRRERRCLVTRPTGLDAELAVRARTGQWARYADVRYIRAEQRLADGREGEALEDLLAVCYLDLNGARYGDGARRFDPDEGILAPQVLERVAALAAHLGTSRGGLHDRFLAVVQPLRDASRAPLAPLSAWRLLAADLGETSPQ